MARDITTILQAYGQGDEGAYEELMALAYDELRRIARRQLVRFRPGRTLDTTGLVHETYLKLVDTTRASFKDRGHFFAIMARAMRQVIVDYARQRFAAKRGGGIVPAELNEELVSDQVMGDQEEAEWLLTLDDALQRLGEIDERMVRVVECRFFSGYTEEETAEALDMSLRTVQRTWQRARGWLRKEMGAI